MSRDDLIEAAREQQTSIDPSESLNQSRVLLNKLEQSLEEGNNYLYKDDESTEQIVYLTTKLALPKPLKPLEWVFSLVPQDAGELAEQLVRPSLHEVSIVKRKSDSLLRVIKDKDHVISRLLEKIDSSAIDLGLIFPGITGLKSRKGRITVNDAKKHVPGMQAFDQQRWLTAFETDSPYFSFDQDGMEILVGGCERCPKHTVQQHADWYRNLPRYNESQDSQRRLSLARGASQASALYHASDTDDDFERQATPPLLRKSKGNEAGSPASSSEDRESQPRKKAKLGKLGGSNNNRSAARASRQSSSSPIPHYKSADKSRRTSDDATGSETETASEAELSKIQTQSHDSPRDKSSMPTRSERAEKSASISPRSKFHNGTRTLGRLSSRNPDSRTSTPSLHTHTPDTDHEKSLPSVGTPPPHRVATESTPLSTPRRRLGTLHRQSSSNISQTQHTKPPITSQDDQINQPSTRSTSNSTTSTPSRKLGRLGRRQRSTSQSHSESGTPSKRATTRRKLDKIAEDEEDDPVHSSSPAPLPQPLFRANHTEESVSKKRSRSESPSSGSTTSTASETQSPPRTRAKDSNPQRGGSVQDNEGKRGESDQPSMVPRSSSVRPEPESEEVKQETEGEKANRRRAELKSRLGGKGSGAGEGVRKRRKF